MAFANDDLSAFFFDIRKDSLYCDAPDAPKRRAYRTVLDTVFHALVRWMSPILCFTAEEVWGTRYPDGGSVHLLEWPEIDAGWRDEALGARWDVIRATRERVTEMHRAAAARQGDRLEPRGAGSPIPIWNSTSPARRLPSLPKSTSCPKWRPARARGSK